MECDFLERGRKDKIYLCLITAQHHTIQRNTRIPYACFVLIREATVMRLCMYVRACVDGRRLNFR
jgi:hypothetical protein